MDTLPPPPIVLGDRWVVDGKLKKGGQGAVLAVSPAHAPGAGGFVAKVMSTGQALEEVRRLHAVSNRNIVRYEDFGQVNDVAAWRQLGLETPAGAQLTWFVMERADTSLADLIGEYTDDSGAQRARSPLGPDESRKLWDQVRSGIRHLHDQQGIDRGERGLLHGDIKPANILRFSGTEDSTWRLADFGICLGLPSSRDDVTALGHTPRYTHPRCLATGRTNKENDLYAAALSVHLAATGRFPALVGARLLPSDDVEPGLRRELETYLNPVFDDSTPDGTIPRSPAPVPVTPGPAPPAPTPRRRPRAFLAAGLVLALVVLLAAAMWRPWSDSGTGGDVTAGSGGAGRLASSSSQGSGATVPDTTPSSGTSSTEVGGSSLLPGEDGADLVFTRGTGDGSSVVRWQGPGTDQTPIVLDVTAPRDPSINAVGNIVVVAGPTASPALAVGSIEGGALRILDVTEAGTVSQPALSPDGSQVAFTTTAGGDKDVVLLDLRTMTTAVLAGGSSDEFEPAWSPDGSQLAFVRSTSVGDQVVVADVASKDVRVVADGDGSKMSPAWSPDGSQLAFVADLNGGRDVLVVSAAGGEATVVRMTALDELQAAWCGVGIVTASARSGLVILDPDGSRESELTSTAGDADPFCVPPTFGASGSPESGS